LEKDDLSSVNFAPDGESLTVEQVSEIACNSWGDGARIQNLKEESDLEARTLQLDSSLAKDKLNWHPKWAQESAVSATVNWWREIYNKNLTAAEACQLDLDYLLQ
jgi:CDP-glucose 4,6-dehydratase